MFGSPLCHRGLSGWRHQDEEEVDNMAAIKHTSRGFERESRESKNETHRVERHENSPEREDPRGPLSQNDIRPVIEP
jgi:hypothetical protein